MQTYTPQQMQRARREMQSYAAAEGNTSRLIGRTGRNTMNIHPAAFQNAIQQNGREVVNDTEYWNDMKRRHPEIDVKYVGNPTVGGEGLIRSAPKSRYGRVKERIRFDAHGKKITETFG